MGSYVSEMLICDSYVNSAIFMKYPEWMVLVWIRFTSQSPTPKQLHYNVIPI